MNEKKVCLFVLKIGIYLFTKRLKNSSRKDCFFVFILQIKFVFIHELRNKNKVILNLTYSILSSYIFSLGQYTIIRNKRERWNFKQTQTKMLDFKTK